MDAERSSAVPGKDDAVISHPALEFVLSDEPSSEMLGTGTVDVEQGEKGPAFSETRKGDVVASDSNKNQGAEPSAILADDALSRPGAFPVAGNRAAASDSFTPTAEPPPQPTTPEISAVLVDENAESGSGVGLQLRQLNEAVTSLQQQVRRSHHQQPVAVTAELVTTLPNDGNKDKEGNRSHRRLILTATFVIIIAAVVGVSVGVSISDKPSPSIQPETAPSPEPTSLETSSPTPADTFRLDSTLKYTHCFYGHMFDITAKTDLNVASMEIHMRSTVPERIEIWTKPGEYRSYENSRVRWARIGEATVTGKGLNVTTSLPRDLFHPVPVKAGMRQAFYVTARTENICFQERFNTTGNVNLIDYGEATEFNNSDLVINVGTGVQYSFQWKNWRPNIFNGAIFYTLGD